LISTANDDWPTANTLALTKANNYAYLLAVISANASVAGISNNQMVSNLRARNARP